MNLFIHLIYYFNNLSLYIISIIFMFKIIFIIENILNLLINIF